MTKLFSTVRCQLGVPLLAMLLAGCAMGPDYVRPDTPGQTQAAFGQLDGWTPAAGLVREVETDWWKAFGDARLDAWMPEIELSNQTLAQAVARARQSAALAAAAQADFYPQVGSNASLTRQGTASGVNNQFGLSANASWLPDIWGRVSRQVEAGRADLDASQADLAAVKLAMQLQLAQQVFGVRVLDAQKVVLEGAVQAYLRSLQLTQNQYEAGLVARSDVVQAQTQLKVARVQLSELEWQRAQMEHAVSVLLGRTPGTLDWAGQPGFMPSLAPVPTLVPSIWLASRPDIVAAERRVAAANARIGVAQTAWFPDLTLGGSGGWQGSRASQWLSAPYRIWSLGPALALTLFDGGKRSAALEQAEAQYDETVAAYRQKVLDAFREVEDALAVLRVLETEAGQQAQVVALAEEGERLVYNRYQSGMVSFLEVTVAQNTTLAAQRTMLDLEGRRLDAAVKLLAALGGGWQGLDDAQSDRVMQ